MQPGGEINRPVNKQFGAQLFKQLHYAIPCIFLCPEILIANCKQQLHIRLVNPGQDTQIAGLLICFNQITLLTAFSEKLFNKFQIDPGLTTEKHQFIPKMQTTAGFHNFFDFFLWKQTFTRIYST